MQESDAVASHQKGQLKRFGVAVAECDVTFGNSSSSSSSSGRGAQEREKEEERRMI